MVLSTAFMTGLNMRRWFQWSIASMYVVALATLLAIAGFVLIFPGKERLIYALAAPCCLIELRLFF
jgi:hypothetical protein